jgi:hypothetical protein
MCVKYISSGTYRPPGYNLGVCRSFSSKWDGERVVVELQFQVKRTYRGYSSRYKGQCTIRPWSS